MARWFNSIPLGRLSLVFIMSRRRARVQKFSAISSVCAKAQSSSVSGPIWLRCGAHYIALFRFTLGAVLAALTAAGPELGAHSGSLSLGPVDARSVWLPWRDNSQTNGPTNTFYPERPLLSFDYTTLGFQTDQSLSQSFAGICWALPLTNLILFPD